MDDKIIFFDSDCLLCNKIILFLLKRDKKGKLKFAQLNGKTAKKVLEKNYLNDNSTILFLNNKKIYMKSNAVLSILKLLNFPYNMLIIFYIIPRFIRDAVYDYIAKNRQKWFGNNKICYLPQPKERIYFLP